MSRGDQLIAAFMYVGTAVLGAIALFVAWLWRNRS